MRLAKTKNGRPRTGPLMTDAVAAPVALSHLGATHIRADLERPARAGMVRNEPAIAHAVAQLARSDA